VELLDLTFATGVRGLQGSECRIRSTRLALPASPPSRQRANDGHTRKQRGYRDCDRCDHVERGGGKLGSAAF